MKLYSISELSKTGYIRVSRRAWIKEGRFNDTVILQCPNCGCRGIKKTLDKNREHNKLTTVCPLCSENSSDLSSGYYKFETKVPRSK